MRLRTAAAVEVVLNMVAMGGYAYMVPAPDSLGYPIYDILVNQIIQGPIGFVLGLVCAGFGARQLIHYNYAGQGAPHFGLSTWVPISCFVWWFAAAALLNADSLMVSLGAVI